MPRPSTGGIVTGHHEEAHQQIRPAIYGTATSHITHLTGMGASAYARTLNSTVPITFTS
ncbi:hypothetical protein [Methylovulum miyakonense]|uniref:hypothetical protein n=1 Tax=Methylovulum miyakonense TaxID=645578 RepID=UPI0012EC9AA5|nr:hypothetical protein [Methylovulum miyakonense]